MQNRRSTKTNRVLSLMMALIMILGILPAISIPVKAAANTDWYYSDPTATSFTISTADQLAGLAELVNGGTDFTGKTIKMMNDIDLSTYTNWSPIGTDNNTPFTGTFNGNGYVINNLIITSTAAYIGLFGVIDSDGEVMNLGVASGTISVTVNVPNANTVIVGGLAGQNYGIITNCYNNGTVSITGTAAGSGTINVGGVTGANNNAAQINNCYNSGTATVIVTGNGMVSVGGVSGGNVSTAQINNSYNSGTVSVTGTANGIVSVGGVSGLNNITAQINNCYNSGIVSSTVSSSSSVGGVVGLNNDSTINNSYNSGTVSGSGDIGGLVGWHREATITNCYYDKTKNLASINAVGFNYLGIVTNSTGLTTAQMTDTDADMMNALGEAFVKSTYDSTTNGCCTGASFYPELKVFAEDPASDFDKAMSKISVIASGITTCTLGTDEQYFVDGNGTSTPYEICTPQQLNHVRKHMGAGVHFKMMCDINLSAYGENYDSGKGWSPIGDSTNQFKGTFDGANHKITGLWIDRNTDNRIGLFGSINDARIQRLGVEADDSKGSVKGGSNIGLLAGYMEGNASAIENCYAVGSVIGNSYAGGLVGYQWNGGSITNSYSMGSVFGTGTSVGGLVGRQNGSITNSYAAGSVSGTGGPAGGLVGNQTGGNTTASFFDMQTTGKVQGVGNNANPSGVTGLTTEEMVMSNVLESTEGGAMSGLGTTNWSKRPITATDDYCYYPELTVFFNGTATQQAASKLSTQVPRIAVTVDTPPTASPIDQGQPLSASTLTGGSASVGSTPIAGTFDWVDGTIQPPVGTANYNAIFTPDNELYKPTIVLVSVMVNAPPTPPTPTPPTTNPNTPFVPTYNPPLTNGTNNSLGDSSNDDSSSNDGTGSNPPAVNNTITVTSESGITITFTYVYTPTGGIVLTASAAAILKVANGNEDSAILCIPLPSGKYIEICFDNIALEAIAKQAGKLGNITITIEIVDKATISRKDRQFVGDSLVFEFIIMGERKGERITDLKGGTMTFTFSQGLTSGENNHDRTIFYRDSKNQIKKSKTGKYHARKNGVNNVVSFTFTEL